MGCGILFVDNTEKNKRASQKVVVYFIKNGKVVHHTTMDQPIGGFYPSVGLAAAGESLFTLMRSQQCIIVKVNVQ